MTYPTYRAGSLRNESDGVPVNGAFTVSAQVVPDEGELIFISMVVTGVTTITNFPAGFTRKTVSTGSSTFDLKVENFYKLAGPVESNSYNFQCTSTGAVGDWACFILHGTTPDLALLLNDSASHSDAGPTTNIVGGVVDTDEDGCFLLIVSAIRALGAIIPPASSTEIAASGLSNRNQEIAYLIQVSQGSYGPPVAVAPNSGKTISITYAFRRANSPPDAPTNLLVTSAPTDTTPVFQADLSDPDSSQQIKARFTLYASDGVTILGTVDSNFITNSLIGLNRVSAEWASALAKGVYFVDAYAIDDLGVTSTTSPQVRFEIHSFVQKDFIVKWKTNALVSKDFTLLYTVLLENIVEVGFVWNDRVTVTLDDLVLLWGQKTPWTPVSDNDDIWIEVID